MSAAQFPLSETFKLHSLSSATKRIYLDFDGHTTTNTLWQTYWRYSDIVTPAFSLDADYGSFSDSEMSAIQEIWARVAEDFAPFAVDVTTEDPGTEALIKSGSGDTAWGVRVVIGGTGSWLGGAGGVAVMNGFGQSDGSPAFAFADQWWKTNPNIVTGIISHEVGHTLGLAHDGPGSGGYYGGHGSGPTGWGPIMGNPDKSLTQWSKGDYKNATNQQDDLAIITANNGFGYRVDDHGNTLLTATVMPGTTTTGIVERNTDVDLFKFTSKGAIKATVSPVAFGANLDILAEILDSTGAVIKTSNPVGAINATFDFTAAAGTYYLRVQGGAEGDPQNGTGYTNYGSLGKYTISLDGEQPPSDVPTISVSNVTLTEGNSGIKQATLRLTLSAAASSAVTVQYATVDGTATTADNDYTASSGTVTFAAGETQKTITVAVKGDTKFESEETLAVAFSNPVGATLASASATVRITNDDSSTPPPASVAILVNDVTVTEGNAGTTVAEFTVSLSQAAAKTVTVAYATANGTASTADGDYLATSGMLTFAVGEMSKKVKVFVYGDTKTEASESFVLVLSAPTNALIAKHRGICTISNDETPPQISVSIADAEIREGHSGQRILSFVVSLSSAAREAITLKVQTSDGTATAGSDYIAVTSRNLVFGRRMMRQSVTVWVNGDRTAEQDETFSVSIVDAIGATISRGTAQGRILNDDPAVISGMIQTAAWAQFAETEASRKANPRAFRGR